MAVERMQYPHGCSRVQHPQVYGRDAISLFRLKHLDFSCEASTFPINFTNIDLEMIMNA